MIDFGVWSVSSSAGNKGSRNVDSMLVAEQFFTYFYEYWLLSCQFFFIVCLKWHCNILSNLGVRKSLSTKGMSMWGFGQVSLGWKMAKNTGGARGPAIQMQIIHCHNWHKCCERALWSHPHWRLDSSRGKYSPCKHYRGYSSNPCKHKDNFWTLYGLFAQVTTVVCIYFSEPCVVTILCTIL